MSTPSQEGLCESSYQFGCIKVCHGLTSVAMTLEVFAETLQVSTM